MPRPVSPEPSDKQLDVLRFILDFLQRHCYQPSVAEMAAHFGVTRNAIMERLRGLQERGFVRLASDNTQRAVTLMYVRCTVYSVEPAEWRKDR